MCTADDARDYYRPRSRWRATFAAALELTAVWIAARVVVPLWDATDAMRAG